MKYLTKTIEYGLYLLVFFLPVQTRWIIKAGFNEYQTYSLYGTDILLLIVLALFIVHNFKFSPAKPGQAILNLKLISNFKFQILNLLMFGLILASAASVFFADDKFLALYKLGWLIMGAGLFWLITKADYNKPKLICSLLAGIFLQAGLGIWQFFSQSSFANKWLGLAAHDAAELGSSVIEAMGADGVGERWLRAYGGADHPNILGGMLAAGIILLIGEIIKHDKFSNSKSQFPIKFQIPNSDVQTNAKAKIFNIFAWVFLIIYGAGIFFSFSRSAWLALATGAGIIAIIAIARRDLKTQKSLAKIILIMGILIFILFSRHQNLAAARLSGEGRLENKSVVERLASYAEAGRLIKNNWLFGVGLGNYTLAARDEISADRPGYFYQPTHNALLLVWAEAGIFGAICFAGLIIYLIIFNFSWTSQDKKFSNLKIKELIHCLEIGNWKLKIGGNENAKNTAINFSILTAIIILLALDHWLWSLHFGVLFFWLVLGLATRGARFSARNF